MPISRKGREAEYRQCHHAANSLLAIKARRNLAQGVSQKHAGDGTGFEIIDMKFVNDKRQYCTNICSVSIVNGINNKN